MAHRHLATASEPGGIMPDDDELTRCAECDMPFDTEMDERNRNVYHFHTYEADDCALVCSRRCLDRHNERLAEGAVAICPDCDDAIAGAPFHWQRLVLCLKCWCKRSKAARAKPRRI
jgi:hypothetical protein